MGEALTKLHGWLGNFGISAARKKVMKNVRDKNGMEKTVHIDSAVVTRWKSRHTETKTKCANSNQLDLDTTIRRLVCPTGVDKTLCDKNIDDLDSVLITDDD